MGWILSIHHNKCNFQIQQKDWVGAAIISDGYHRVKYTDIIAMKIWNSKCICTTWTEYCPYITINSIFNLNLMVRVGAAILSEKSSLKWMIQIQYQWKF